MRLTFFFENYVVGGGSKYVIDCINAALLRGDEVCLLSNLEALDPSEARLLAWPIRQVTVRIFERDRFSARLFSNTRWAAVFRKLLVFLSPAILLMNVVETFLRLGQERPDVLVACNGGYPAAESALAAVLAARLRGIPSVLLVMSQPAQRRRFLPGYDWLLDWLVFAAVSRVVANSSLQVRELVQRRSALGEKMHRIYNGIPDVVTQAQDVAKGLPASSVLGVVCRLDRMKGLDYLLRAVSLLPACYPVQCRIVGDGDERHPLEQLVQELELADRVEFRGFLQGEALLRELGEIDIYVFPSLWEGLPYSLLEAMRAGLPIVSTNVGGIPEAIRDQVDGITVPPRSAEALAKAIRSLLQDPALADRFARSARKRYEELFSLQRMQQDFVTVVAAASRGAETKSSSPGTIANKETTWET